MDASLKNAHILVVDDQQANVDVLEVYFEMQGYDHIKTLTDPREVIPALKTFQPDVILLDLTMPYLSGFEVMDLIKAELGEEVYLPVLVLTADITPETKQRAISRGAHDFLVKPFDLFEVGIRIRNLLYSRYLWSLSRETGPASVKTETVEEKDFTTQNALKDKTFSVIIHDLKNPFSTMISSSNLLMKTLEKDNPEKDKLMKVAKNLNDASVFGYKLLLNLLEYFRLQTGTAPFNPKMEDIKQLVSEALSNLAPAIEKKQIEVITDIPQGLSVFADARMIVNVAEQLVSNAVKYSFNTGVITIAARQQDKMIEVSVTDHGMGIDDSLKDKLFRMEEKFSCAGTENESGTGMGLLLCKEYLDRHHGKIWFDSEGGGGTTFYFTLATEVGH